MRKKLAALLALLLSEAIPLGIGYYLSQAAPGGPVYRGKTVGQWEAELRGWEPRLAGVGIMSPPILWWGKRPTWRQQLSDWWDSARGSGPPPRVEAWVLPGGLGRGPEAVPVLTELLRSRDPVVRRAAAQTLGTIGEPAAAAIPALAAVLTDPDPDVRVTAEGALRCIWAAAPADN